MSMRLFNRYEPVLIKTVISDPPVEALHEGVLNGLAGTDEVKLHSLLVGPCVKRVTYEFRIVIDYNAVRKPHYGSYPG